VEQLLAATGLARRDLAGVIVGIGPGAFTGLRVGLATAKTLAHALHLPIAGVGTGEALLAAVEEGDPRPASEPGTDLLLLPAGPHDRVEVRPGAAPRLLPGGTDPRMGPRDRLVAVDLDGRAPDLAAALGAAARDRLGATLLRLGAARLSAGTTDDPERLVPEYVTLPRGVKATGGEIAWSTDPR
jgi:tRNA threonylcarbamoyladenosine biosynthesis protein TsaB